MTATARIPLIDPAQHIMAWGETMKLARRASALAVENARQRKLVRDRMECSLDLLTDCPVTAGWFAHEQDMAAICGVSHINSVRMLIGNLADPVPTGLFEAERSDPDMPRIWARLVVPANITVAA